MDKGIDTGQLLFQQPFSVEDQILETNQRMIEAVYNAIPKLLGKLLDGDPKVTQTNKEVFSNYWRKRDLHDITLDPRMSSAVAKRIVNSFKPPYSGARLYIGVDEYLVITNVQEVTEGDCIDYWVFREHGYVFESHHDHIVVRFDDAVLSLDIHSTLDRNLAGNKLHPPSFYLCY
jgi:methionyl-tRNA formyltransferase